MFYALRWSDVPCRNPCPRNMECNSQGGCLCKAGFWGSTCYQRKFNQVLWDVLLWHGSRGVTGIFFWGGKVIFPEFFSRRGMLFPVENSHFGRSKTKFRRFQKWKAKKKKSSHLFYNFSYFNFPPSLLQFSFFSSQFSPLFPFFLASFFPIRQQKFPGQKSLGGTLPPCPPPPVTPLHGRRHCIKALS